MFCRGKFHPTQVIDDAIVSSDREKGSTIPTASERGALLHQGLDQSEGAYLRPVLGQWNNGMCGRQPGPGSKVLGGRDRPGDLQDRQEPSGSGVEVCWREEDPSSESGDTMR